MKTKRYLTLIMVITVGCIIAGSLYHIGFFNRRGSGISKNAEPLTQENGSAWTGWDKLDIQSEVMNISIIKGDSFRAVYSGDEKYRPRIEQLNDTLQIVQKTTGWLHFGIFPESNLQVTIPENMEVKEIKVDSDTGHIVLRGISCGSTRLSSDTGKIEVTDSAAGDLKAETDTGDVQISGSAAGNIDMESDTGDLSVSGSAFGDIRAETDTGDVEVQTSSGKDQADPSLDLSTDTGDVIVYGEKMAKNYRYDGQGKNRVRISTDTGDITLLKNTTA